MRQVAPVIRGDLRRGLAQVPEPPNGPDNWTLKTVAIGVSNEIKRGCACLPRYRSTEHRVRPVVRPLVEPDFLGDRLPLGVQPLYCAKPWRIFPLSGRDAFVNLKANCRGF